MVNFQPVWSLRGEDQSDRKKMNTIKRVKKGTQSVTIGGLEKIRGRVRKGDFVYHTGGCETFGWERSALKGLKVGFIKR